MRRLTAISALALSVVLPRAAHAVGNGTTDVAGQYPYVVHLSFAGGSCSGVLVTPTWILTANHCVTGDNSCVGGSNQGGDVNGRYDVRVDSIASGPASDAHT